MNCRICNGDMERQPHFTLCLQGNGKSLFRADVCDGCVKKAFGWSDDKTAFMACYCEYKVKKSLASYDEWDNRMVAEFVTLLKKWQVPVRSYGIPLWTEGARGTKYYKEYYVTDYFGESHIEEEPDEEFSVDPDVLRAIEEGDDSLRRKILGLDNGDS